MLHVGNFSFGYWIVVFINNSVKILGDSFSNIMELFVVVLFCYRIYKSWQTDRGKVAYSNFVFASVLNNLGA